jgi:hypothetical protein
MAKHVAGVVVEQKGVKSDMLMNKHTSVEPNLIYIPFPGLKFASLLRRKTSAALRWHIRTLRLLARPPVTLSALAPRLRESGGDDERITAVALPDTRNEMAAHAVVGLPFFNSICH